MRAFTPSFAQRRQKARHPFTRLCKTSGASRQRKVHVQVHVLSWGARTCGAFFDLFFASDASSSAMSFIAFACSSTTAMFSWSFSTCSRDIRPCHSQIGIMRATTANGMTEVCVLAYGKTILAVSAGRFCITELPFFI